MVFDDIHNLKYNNNKKQMFVFDKNFLFLIFYLYYLNQVNKIDANVAARIESIL